MDKIYVSLFLFVAVIVIAVVAVISTMLLYRKMHNIRLKLKDISESSVV